MIKEVEIVLLPEQASDNDAIRQKIRSLLNITEDMLKDVQVRKRSIDARSRHTVYRLRVVAYVDEHPPVPVQKVEHQNVSGKNEVIIVGAGPAGLFAALECIELGLKPIIFERGKDVRQRRRDLAAINKDGIVNTESNYCYGEGGAGTYSDGKLYTRSNKRGDIQKVLQIFVDHGADPDIMVDARPHIGTNKLPNIITGIREQILSAGGEVHFDHKLTDLEIEDGEIRSATFNDSIKIPLKALILATGHSAHDIYELLHRRGILIEAKEFAMGLRIEHPQVVIDKAQYNAEERSPFLPPAYYSLVEQVKGRGVFSFCMCPGGIIAPCATADGEVVVNGWSPSKRNNPFANSGIVVQVGLKDVPGTDPLRMLRFQNKIERKAFQAAGGNLKAPAQRMIDFVEHKLSASLPKTSYLPGVTSVEMDDVLPEFIVESLRGAFPMFGKKMRGYFTNEAVLVGVESRTSAPVRIPRDRDTFQHPEVAGFFPCAEGAGYAGGIVSAAIDGINCSIGVKSWLEHKQH